MIHLTFHWLYLLLGAILAFGIYWAYKFFKRNDGFGINPLIGCLVLLITLLVIMSIGGFCLW